MPTSITLDTHDQKLFAEALRALVSVDAAQPETWERRVLRSLKRLVRAERGGFFYTSGADLPAGTSDDYDDGVMAAYRAYYGERDPGRQRLVAGGDPVFSRARLFGGDLDPLVRSECYNDFLAPASMGDSTGMALPDEGHGSPGMIALHRSDFGSDDFAHTAPALLRLLYPAFVSGWRARRRLDRETGDLARIVDALPEATAAYSADGRLLHANPRLRDHLSARSGGELRRSLDRVVAASGELLRGEGPADAPADPASPSGFRLRVTLLHSVLPRPVVLVTAESARAARVPSSKELIRRFGLTRRQAEVATLLARRLTNPEIAERLFISPHTAKRHTEAVMEKIGLRDRRLIADRLGAPARNQTAGAA